MSGLADSNPSYRHIERDYLERTIATVRSHRGADNCWPQWANIFADEIERLWKIEDALPAPAGVCEEEDRKARRANVEDARAERRGDFL